MAASPPARLQVGPCRVRIPDSMHSRQSLSKFPDISADMIDAHWYVVGSRPWRNKQEHIVTLEGRESFMESSMSFVVHVIIVVVCSS